MHEVAQSCPTSHWCCFHFLNSFYPLCFILHSFCCYVFKCIIFSFLITDLLLITFHIYTKYLWYFYILNDSAYILNKWNIIVMSLFANSNILVSSGWVSIDYLPSSLWVRFLCSSVSLVILAWVLGIVNFTCWVQIVLFFYKYSGKQLSFLEKVWSLLVLLR